MRAAIYLRVSSDERPDERYSIASQRFECTKFAKEHGATTITEFKDEGVSGAIVERPGLKALRAAVKAGTFDLVVAWDPDRFVRHLGNQILITEEIEAKCTLAFVNFEWQRSPEGQLFYQLRGAFSQFEREKIRQRTMLGRLQKARSGKLPFAMEPYGYTYDRAHSMLVIRPDEAQTVRRIFDEYVRQVHGLNGIAKELTADGIPTRKGGVWHRQTVRQILMNPVYKGVYWANRRDLSGVSLNKYKTEGKHWGTLRPRDEWIAVKVPAIVDEEIWEEAQQLLERGKRLWASRRLAYLLSGLICCHRCGNTMTGVQRTHWGKKIPSYTCRKSTAGAKNRGCPRFVAAATVDQAVWEHVVAWLQNPHALANALMQTHSPDEWAAEREQIRQALAQVAISRRHILLALERGLVPASEALDSLNRLKQREARLTEKTALIRARSQPTTSANSVAYAADVLQRLSVTAPFAVRQNLVRQFVVGVDVGDGTLIIRARIPNRSVKRDDLAEEPRSMASIPPHSR